MPPRLLIRLTVRIISISVLCVCVHAFQWVGARALQVLLLRNTYWNLRGDKGDRTDAAAVTNAELVTKKS